MVRLKTTILSILTVCGGWATAYAQDGLSHWLGNKTGPADAVETLYDSQGDIESEIEYTLETNVSIVKFFSEYIIRVNNLFEYNDISLGDFQAGSGCYLIISFDEDIGRVCPDSLHIEDDSADGSGLVRIATLSLQRDNNSQYHGTFQLQEFENDILSKTIELNITELVSTNRL